MTTCSTSFSEPPAMVVLVLVLGSAVVGGSVDPTVASTAVRLGGFVPDVALPSEHAASPAASNPAVPPKNSRLDQLVIPSSWHGRGATPARVRS
jgi:hypothetical protein